MPGQQRLEQQNEEVQVSHAAENHIRLDCAHQAQQLRRGSADLFAVQPMDLHGGRESFGAGEILRHQAEMYLESPRVKVSRQLGHDALRAASAEVRNEQQ